MSRLRKKYPCGQKRGGLPGSAVKTDSTDTGKTRKDYSNQVKQHWGAEHTRAQDRLRDELKKKGLVI